MVVVDKTEYELNEDENVKVPKVLEETVQGGRVGALHVDPESLVYQEPGTKPRE